MPTETRVLNARYTVRAVESIDVLVHADDPEHAHTIANGAIGTCDSDEQVIRLVTEQGYDRFKETFLHEHLHAMVAAAALDRDAISHDQEESVCKRLAPILMMFLRDNPVVVKWLTQ
jgi:hypothetical protein